MRTKDKGEKLVNNKQTNKHKREELCRQTTTCSELGNMIHAPPAQGPLVGRVCSNLQMETRNPLKTRTPEEFSAPL